jgi:hypothetical protein
MDPLFPELPENLSELSDDELAVLLREHEIAAEKLDAEDPEYTKGLSGDEIIEQYEAGVAAIEKIVDVQKERIAEQEAYQARKDELSARRAELSASEEEPEPEPEPEPSEPEPDSEGEEASAEVEELAEVSEPEEEVTEEPSEQVAEVEVVTASARKPALRRPPSPSEDRKVAEAGAILIAAAGQVGIRGGVSLDRLGLADAYKKVAQSVGTPTKSAAGIEQKFLVASAQYRFPEERRLLPGEPDANARKIQKIVPMGIPGVFGNRALTASGGLCAPLEPIYSMPNFASMARPVRDSLPSFQAERGGVNVPTATYIGDITSAISLITEAEDALGGTYATKSCQDLDCPDYTEVAVTTVAHCREYGNLNARAWPEKIAHENDLTMAAHAATAESYLLDRIRSLSIVLNAAKVIGAYADLVRDLLRARAQIVSVLRMDNGVRFRVLAPEWITDELAADTASTQFDRFESQAAMAGHLGALGFSVGFYKDEVHSGTSQKFAAASAGNLAAFPTVAQIAVFPEGEFLHIDSGTLELGLVRDSTLNSTNDFQIFGESFENVARLGPAQGALWLNAGICATGEFPSTHAAYGCAAG